MRPVKYLKPQLSPEELEAEQACHEILGNITRKRYKYYDRIQEVFAQFMEQPDPFTIEEIHAQIPGSNTNSIRTNLTEEQKAAMRARRSPKATIDEAFVKMQLQGGPISITELARLSGHNPTTLGYHLSPEQHEWIQKRRRQ